MTPVPVPTSGDPVAPVAPVTPADPAAPVAPTAPAAPAAPADPVAPVAPTAPADPVASVAPTAPVAPPTPAARRGYSLIELLALAVIVFCAILVMWLGWRAIRPAASNLLNAGQSNGITITAENRQWYDQDGYAVVGDGETPRFPHWVAKQYLWPDTLEVYSGEWGEGYTLSGVEGLQSGDTLFVAMRDVQKWVYQLSYTAQVPEVWDSTSPVHLECAGTLIPRYDPTTMGNWEIPNATVVKVVGNNNITEILRMTAAWNLVRSQLNGCP